MFCGKCGTQLNADGTCPKCGSSSNITTTVTTRHNIMPRLIILVIFGLIMVALGVFVIAQGNDMAVFYRLRVNKNVGTLICMLLGLILIYTPVGSVLVLLRQGKSFLTVSPQGIEGVAISGKANAFVPNGLKVENVSLMFSEIQKCTASVENGQKKVIIYTTYGNHEFLGGDNYEQVAKTIQNALNR